jgi:Rrf2 family protein
MVDLAVHQKDGSVPLEVLAEDQQIPERYLSKIVQDLRRSGLIRSARGAHGGYILGRDPSQIRVLDIWQALDGPLCPVDCLDRPEECRMSEECVTRDVWEKVRKALAKVLAAETLDGLARRYKAKVARNAKARRPHEDSGKHR